MSLIGDAANQRRLSIGKPADSEKRSGGIVSGQQLEQPIHAGLHPARHPVPLAARNRALERQHLEILLDVH